MALLALPGVALAQDDEDWRLVKVTADTAEQIQQLDGRYDVGYIGELNEAAVYVDDETEALLRAEGYTIGATVQTRADWPARKAEIAATDAREALRGAVRPRRHAEVRHRREGQADRPDPGRDRDHERTTPSPTTRGASSTSRRTTRPTRRPAARRCTMSYAGTDGVFKTAGTMGGPGGSRADADTATRSSTRTVYQYNRVLFALRGADANLTAADITVRVAASSGSSDTSKVTEWANKGLPPRVAGFQKDFITKYMDPTESYARLDQLAAQYPDIAEIVHLPEQDERLPAPRDGDDGGHDGVGHRTRTTANQPLAVQLFSKAMGHFGGNLITAEFKNPGAATRRCRSR